MYTVIEFYANIIKHFKNNHHMLYKFVTYLLINVNYYFSFISMVFVTF